MLTIRRGIEEGRPAARAGAVALLLECHGRIRELLGVARRLGEAIDPPPAEVVAAAERVVRYFGEALPLHAQDEELSIAPRLLGLDPFVDAELVAMTREHREHEPALAALLSACGELARAPGRHAELAAVVARSAVTLERHFALHLAREEAVVFPAIARLLDREADAAIVAELRARRQG
jgi:hemerythrin-like domain-containing protein